MYVAIGAICYYGWPFFEALLIIAPIPDVENLTKKASEYVNKAMNLV